MYFGGLWCISVFTLTAIIAQNHFGCLRGLFSCADLNWLMGMLACVWSHYTTCHLCCVTGQHLVVAFFVDLKLKQTTAKFKDIPPNSVSMGPFGLD